MIDPSRRIFLASLLAGGASVLPRSGAHAGDSTHHSEDGICILTPQAEEGPFYLDPKLVRADIAEGRAGTPLDLRLRVIEAGPCKPIAGARVDIWHCDALGLYSGYPGQGDSHTIDDTGQTFLRGTQMTDAAGWVRFETIYPGWYDGRTTHVHFKVFLDEKNVLTGQTFFPDALSEYLYAKVQAYGGRRFERSVVNTNDLVAKTADPERKSFCAIKEDTDRYVATLTLGVDRNAVTGNQPRRPPPPPGPPNLADGGRPFWAPPRMSAEDRLAAIVPGPRRKF